MKGAAGILILVLVTSCGSDRVDEINAEIEKLKGERVEASVVSAARDEADAAEKRLAETQSALEEQREAGKKLADQKAHLLASAAHERELAERARGETVTTQQATAAQLAEAEKKDGEIGQIRSHAMAIREQAAVLAREIRPGDPAWAMERRVKSVREFIAKVARDYPADPVVAELAQPEEGSASGSASGSAWISSRPERLPRRRRLGCETASLGCTSLIPRRWLLGRALRRRSRSRERRASPHQPLSLAATLTTHYACHSLQWERTARSRCGRFHKERSEGFSRNTRMDLRSLGMQKTLPFGLLILGMRLLSGCAPTGSFETDADQCHSVEGASAGEDYRLPEAVDETTGERVLPVPQDTSAYVLCMRSRGWKLDPTGRPVDKGLSAGEYSQVVSQDLTICVHGADAPELPKPSAEQGGSSAARVVCACLEKATPGITSVDLHLVVGEGGEIRRVSAQPESPVASCLQQDLLGTAVVEPPSAPWKVVVRILHYQ